LFSFKIRGVLKERIRDPLAGLPGPKKLKRPNLAISSFKKGQILKNEKRPNKGQISLKKIVKITKLKFRIS
jgi:hypothetical protein